MFGAERTPSVTTVTTPKAPRHPPGDLCASACIAVLLALAEKLPTVRGRFDLDVSARRAPEQAQNRGEHEESDDDEDHERDQARSLLPNGLTIKRGALPACTSGLM